MTGLWYFLCHKLLLHPIFLLLLSGFLFALSFPSSFVEHFNWPVFRGLQLALQNSLQSGMPLFVFVFAVPLLYVLLQLRSLPEAIFYGAFYGFGSYLLLSLWLLEYDWIAFILVPSIYIVYFAVLFAFYVLLNRLLSTSRLRPEFVQTLRYAAFLLFWMVLEYVKSTGWVAYTYGTLLYSHYLWPAVMAFSANFWLQNLSYILILLPAICAHALGVKYQKWKQTAMASGSRSFSQDKGQNSNSQGKLWGSLWQESRGLILLAVLAVAALHLSFYWTVDWQQPEALAKGQVQQPANGQETVEAPLPVSADYLNVALVQHNINSWQTEEDTSRQAFIRLLELSREAEAHNAELIVWSETAFVPVFRFNRDRELGPPRKNIEDLDAQIEKAESEQTRRELQDNLSYFRSVYDELLMAHELQEYLEQANATYLIGTNDYGQPDEFPGERRWGLYNSLLLVRSGQILATYHKQLLVPFTEEAKFEKWLPKLNTMLRRNGFAQYSAGKNRPVLSLPLQGKVRSSLRFYSMICYEDSLPLYWPHRLLAPPILAEALAQGDFDILLSVSNDSWSPSPIGGLQHLSSFVSRTIETGRYLLRTSTSGQTAVVNPQGQILKRLKPNQSGVLYFRLPLQAD